MDITTLENWLWEAACSIRGPLDAPKYKDYILPLLFYKHPCDVFADEPERLNAIITNEETARNDYNLSPSRYVASNDVEPPLPLEEALVLLAEAELSDVLAKLGFTGWANE